MEEADFLVNAQPKVQGAAGSVPVDAHDLRALEASLKPSMNLSAGYTTRRTSTRSSSELVQGVATARLTLDWVLYDAGEGKSLRDAALAREQKAEKWLAENRNNARSEIIVALEDAKAESEKQAILKLAVVTAAQAVDLAKGRYKSGVGNLLELLRAENDYGTSKLQLSRATYNGAIATYRIETIRGNHDF